MLSSVVQIALSELGQVDVLIEMMVQNLTKVPITKRGNEWYESFENALYLLETTYKAKKEALILALKGGVDNE
jgi:hypothetical protein